MLFIFSFLLRKKFTLLCCYGTGQLLYEIVNDSLEGSYSSSLCVRVGCGVKYGFAEQGYFIELEGSYHKITKGYNSHDGIYNLQFIVKGFIELAENSYDVKLPAVDKWYLQRIDIAKCFDIEKQKNVIEYINSLSSCTYSIQEEKQNSMLEKAYILLEQLRH